MKSWMPTRLNNGEGRVGQGRNRQVHLFWSTGVMGTACQEGDLGNWGRPGAGRGRASNASGRLAARPGVGEGQSTVEAG